MEGGEVIAGEGVHPSRQRAAAHRKEQIPHRKTSAAAQHQMLQHVGDTTRVRWRGKEADQERVGRVVAGQMDMPCTGAAMSEFLKLEVSGRD